MHDATGGMTGTPLNDAIRVDQSPDGSEIAHRTSVSANDFGATGTLPQVGDVMPADHAHAGRLYAGISGTTHRPFYAAPKDSGVFKWDEAMAFAAGQGARAPSREELDQMHEARHRGSFKGTFNETGPASAYWYWSSLQNGHDTAWAQSFSDSNQTNFGKILGSSLRCVWD